MKNITINLVYVLGEIGEIVPLEKQNLEFLEDTYYKSDRWIRNEIIQALSKASKKSRLPNKLIRLIGFSLNDDYDLIKINSLKAILNFNQISDFILKNVIKMLELKNSEIIDYCSMIIKKSFKNPKQLYDFLNQTQAYKEVKKDTLRNLLIISCNSILHLESFREAISKSGWEKEIKENYMNEIDTYEKILLKNL